MAHSPANVAPFCFVLFTFTYSFVFIWFLSPPLSCHWSLIVSLIGSRCSEFNPWLVFLFMPFCVCLAGNVFVCYWALVFLLFYYSISKFSPLSVFLCFALMNTSLLMLSTCYLTPAMTMISGVKRTMMRLMFKCPQWLLPQVIRQRLMWMILIIKIRTSFPLETYFSKFGFQK